MTLEVVAAAVGILRETPTDLQTSDAKARVTEERRTLLAIILRNRWFKGGEKWNAGKMKDGLTLLVCS